MASSKHSMRTVAMLRPSQAGHIYLATHLARVTSVGLGRAYPQRVCLVRVLGTAGGAGTCPVGVLMSPTRSCALSAVLYRGGTTISSTAAATCSPVHAGHQIRPKPNRYAATNWQQLQGSVTYTDAGV